MDTPARQEPPFSLIIPCFNEEESIPELVLRARLVSTVSGGQIVFVNNGSTDRTAEYLSREVGIDDHISVVTLESNAGYGGGILAGLAQAEGGYVGWSHADLQSDVIDALRAWGLISQHSSPVFVKGRRYGRPMADVFFSLTMAACASILLGKRMADINAQPTFFPRELLSTWTNPPEDFGLDAYAYFSALKYGCQVFRIPVVFDQRKFGVSSWNTTSRSRLKFIRRTVHTILEIKGRL